MNDALSSLSFRRVSAAEQVASILRDRILRGEIKPGTSLREVVMAATIGVSRNRLREALRILIQEGLVRHIVHRGITVTQLSPESIFDIYRIRRLLEMSAVEGGRLNPQGLGFLGAALDRLEKAADDQDWPALVEGDMRFHQSLVGLLGSERLDGFFWNLLPELRRSCGRRSRFQRSSPHAGGAPQVLPASQIQKTKGVRAHPRGPPRGLREIAAGGGA